ncbi:hypothetical protein ACVW00_003891 [Marmoricola sp. URHA0025 HA25]
MGIWVVQQFSVREADRESCLAALKSIGAHIEAEHPEILAIRTEWQWVGDRAHRAFSWAEEFASLTAIDESVHTPGCDDVWRPVLAIITEGTHFRGVWTGAEPSWSRTPAP